MWQSSVRASGAWLTFLALACCPAAAAPPEEKVRVTVVAVLASDKHKEVDPLLKCLAEKLQELDAKLTGFRAGRMTSKILTPGAEATFPLVEDQSAFVILEPKPKQGKGTCVSVKTPGVGIVTYTIKCEKCFPIGTSYQTRKGERLIVGVLVEPIEEKPKPKKPAANKEVVLPPKR